MTKADNLNLNIAGHDQRACYELPAGLTRDHMLKALDEASEWSRANNGRLSDDKDELASKAIMLASYLFQHLAGWAIDHKVGLAIEGVYTTSDEEMTYEAVQERANSEKLEVTGRLIRAETLNVYEEEAVSKRDRAIVSTVLHHTYGYILPKGICDRLCEGLEALSFGEKTALMTPAKSFSKHRLREMRSQLKACAHVQFLKHRGLKSGEAQAEMSQHYGVAIETLRKWDRSVRDGLGEYVYYSAMLNAERAAKEFWKLKDDPHNGPVAHEIADMLKTYTISQRRADGAAYKELLTLRKQERTDPAS